MTTPTPFSSSDASSGSEFHCDTTDSGNIRCIINASHPQLPLLFIPIKDSEERLLYNVVEDKTYDFRVKIPTGRCCGSSHGWLFKLEETKSLTLLNPFSNKTISLPPITQGDEDFSEIFVWKAVLSKDPILYPHDYEVAVIYDGVRRFALYQAKTKTWTYFADQPQRLTFDDVIYHKGSFYVVDYWMGVAKVESLGRHNHNSVSQPRLHSIVPRSLPKWMRVDTVHDVYMVETFDGDLLLAVRLFHKKDYPAYDNEHIMFTEKFRVFKIESELNNSEVASVEEIRDLGENAIFLGCNSSLLVPTRELQGLQRNCIYYTNDRMDFYNPIDAGIFNLENQSISSHYALECDEDLPPTNWVVPSFMSDHRE